MIEKENLLSENQVKILEEFISKFLPKRGNKRKGTHNEIDYVGRVLLDLFKQNFGFRLSRKNILNSVEKLNYNVFTSKGEWDNWSARYKPSATGDVVRSNEGYIGYDACFIYIDIEATKVRELKMATHKRLPHSTDEKIAEVNKLKEKINEFKTKMKEKYPLEFVLQNSKEKKKKSTQASN